MKKDLEIWYAVGVGLVIAGLLLMVLALFLTPKSDLPITTEKSE